VLQLFNKGQGELKAKMRINKTETKLIELYEKMYRLTLPECKSGCRAPLSCCSPDYCDLALEWARDEWSIDLKPFSYIRPSLKEKGLPFMDKTGCVVAPHLRPLCTLHVCCIESLGCHPKSMTWTNKYFKLRDEINELERKRKRKRRIK
jgi:hypothetical protein